MQAKAEDAARLLEWLAAMGADEIVCDRPADWLAPSAFAPPAPAERRQPSRPAPAMRPVPPPRPDARLAPPPAILPTATRPDPAFDSRQAAKRAATLAELRDLVAAFDGCALKKTAKSLCFSRGSEKARVMLIGEAPGRDEDLQGLPFVGRAGQLLDRMLAAIGLDESSVHIANVVYWRPPGNRAPTPQEAQACQPFLDRQIELVDPELLVFLGGTAAKQLTGSPEGIMKLRGRWLTCEAGGRPRRSIATLHPAYLLRTPASKRLAWRDLLMIEEALDAGRGRPPE